MKTETILTRMADRDARSTWEKKGAMDVHARAMNRVKEIMKQNTIPFIPTEIDEKLQAKFPGLVKGLLEEISDSNSFVTL
jgi:trimethylamine:corrinoid methyltransferase-like protein